MLETVLLLNIFLEPVTFSLGLFDEYNAKKNSIDNCSDQNMISMSLYLDVVNWIQ